MPRKPIDYSKCVFYRLVCRDVSVTEVYVGHTTSEVDRRATHKSCCNNEKGKSYNLFVYRFIRDHGGFDNWMLIVHEKLPVKDDVEARLRERFWAEHYQAKLNSNVPGRTRAEYDAAHVKEIKEYTANYRANHRVERKEYNANYHYEHNETQNQKSAARNLAKSEYLNKKHNCPCGGCYTTRNKCGHFKTKKHIAALK